MRMTIRKWVLAGMFAAIYVALSAFTVDLRLMKISFSGLAVVLGALLMGPMPGAMIGFAGAFLEQILKYGLAPTTLMWVMPVMARGWLVGMLSKRCRFDPTPKQIAMITVVSAVFLTLLNTVAIFIDSKLYGYYTFQAVFGMVFTRLATGIATSFAYLLVIAVVYKRLKRFMAEQR